MTPSGIRRCYVGISDASSSHICGGYFTETIGPEDHDTAFVRDAAVSLIGRLVP